ncbi:helix-turn-helix transcriptional regulator [Geodermatophilus sabuli]|uniref:Predicted transcriptional regulator, ArsR family n=1 Tax=Geodermatophilus sabuli TaxID=1564158 RepID=A0A285E706_9ACTN|nr:helix-turn-helix domain-containing protein [Geodermatophilus sabuli]MBB3082218.1 putative ArsR family transcriptional regulator [Geodermatophilus sabuli]SNX94909.1 Predicted transcriptional regulator, ArsR family [Geodermatophilus sabuli]
MDADRSARVAAVAALAEPTRRRLYDFVARQPAPVSRDDAAAALGVPRPTTAFHLDRLVADGLLEVSFERRTGRTGPGAGRPAKLYRRAACAVEVSLPERRYDLAGELLAGALEEADASGEPPRAVLGRRARARGRELGAAAGSDGAPARGRVVTALEAAGFEPRVEDDAAGLANCPFHALAQEHTELVCGMNLQLLEGLLESVPGTGWTARLAPRPGRCCVRLEPGTAP